MNKAEKMFWVGLLLATGMIIGALMVSFTSNTKKSVDCNDGISEEVKEGVRIKTYMPALDTCKDNK